MALPAIAAIAARIGLAGGARVIGTRAMVGLTRKVAGRAATKAAIKGGATRVASRQAAQAAATAAPRAVPKLAPQAAVRAASKRSATSAYDKSLPTGVNANRLPAGQASGIPQGQVAKPPVRTAPQSQAPSQQQSTGSKARDVQDTIRELAEQVGGGSKEDEERRRRRPDPSYSPTSRSRDVPPSTPGGSSSAGSSGNSFSNALSSLQQSVQSYLGGGRGGSASSQQAGASNSTAHDRVLSKSFGDIMSGKTNLADELADETARNRADEALDAEAKKRAEVTAGLKKMASGISMLTAGMVGLVKASDLVGKALLSKQSRLAEYGGTIAGSMAELEASRIHRGAREARATGPSTARLARSQNELEEALLPWKVASINFQLWAVHYFTRLGTTLTKMAEYIPGMKSALDALGADDTDKADVNAWMYFIHRAAEGDLDPKFPPVKDL